MRLPAPDWLHHRLAISGAAADLAEFRRAAAGAGVIPWQLDLERMQEDFFHLLASAGQRRLSVAGARIFAKRLRDAVARRHELALARAGHSQACPFDLHALVAVPPEILALGPDAPDALAWLWQHWGTTEALRHVIEDRAGAAAPHLGDDAEEHFQLSFWSADWTPWRALDALGARWPALRFDIRPTYDLP